MNGLAVRLPDIVKILLALGIAYTLISTIWHFISGPEQATLQQPSASVQRGPSKAPAVDISALINANIFGDISAAPAVEEVKPSDEPAKETRLPLTLLGVFQAEQAEESAAIVAQKGKAGLRYTVGETMPGNAELVEVHADRIILRRAGVRETLRFPKSDEMISATGDSVQAGRSSGSRNAAANGTASRSVGQARITPPTRNRSQAGGGRGLGSQPTSTRELVAEYRDRLAEDPEGTLNSIGLTPVTAGDAQGYRLGALANSPQLANTGLQSGDVLLSVNGQPVGDIQSDRSRIDGVLSEGSARLEVQRGDRRFFVTAALP